MDVFSSARVSDFPKEPNEPQLAPHREIRSTAWVTTIRTIEHEFPETRLDSSLLGVHPSVIPVIRPPQFGSGFLRTPEYFRIQLQAAPAACKSQLNGILKFGSPSVSQLEPYHKLAKSGEYAAESNRFLYTVGANPLIAGWIGRIERLPTWLRTESFSVYRTVCSHGNDTNPTCEGMHMEVMVWCVSQQIQRGGCVEVFSDCRLQSRDFIREGHIPVNRFGT